MKKKSENKTKKSEKFSKLKKFYKDNRIFCILMVVSIICVLVIGISLIVYFVNQSESSVYGSRLDGISEHKTDEDFKKLNEYYKSQDIVTNQLISLKGKIIYIEVDVKEDATKDKVENLGVESLDLISKENFEYYDIEFIFKRPNYDTYFGSCSKSKTVISWAHTFDIEPNNKETKE